MKPSVLAVFLILLISGLAGVWYFSQSTADDSVLVVGTNVGYPPFTLTSDEGLPAGFDIDLMYEVGKLLNKKIVFKDMAFDALLVALKLGVVDVVIGGISVTPQRAAVVPFVTYHGQAQPKALMCMHEAVTNTLTCLDDLENLSRPIVMCTQAGTIFEEILAQYPQVTVKTYDDIAPIFLDVQFHKSDGCLLDADAIECMQPQHTALVPHMVRLPDSYQTIGFGIGIDRSKEQLYLEIRDAITELQRNGTLKKLRTTWFSNSKDA